MAGLSQDELKKSFDDTDKDHNGYLTSEEILGNLSVFGNNVSEDKVRQIRDKIAEVDVNKDGKLDFDEFVKLVTETK
jgi:Ca2+-binding EF-hand superfamily protein